MTTPIVVVNPYKVMMSGITVGTSPVNISASGVGIFPEGLACNAVIIENLGGSDVYIHHKSTDVAIEGFEVTNPSATNINSITLPINRYTTLWAATATGTANIRMIFY